VSDLDAALDTARRLRDALVGEIESARGERRLLRTLDASGLFERATHRSAFLAEVQRLERMLAIRMQDLARSAGRRPAAPPEAPAAPPGRAAALADAVAEIRALAGALAEIDRLNAALARRALAVVRGYVDALQPAPGTYDRSGARAATPALALVRSQG
jgi:hypothetical protein